MGDDGSRHAASAPALKDTHTHTQHTRMRRGDSWRVSRVLRLIMKPPDSEAQLSETNKLSWVQTCTRDVHASKNSSRAVRPRHACLAGAARLAAEATPAYCCPTAGCGP